MKEKLGKDKVGYFSTRLLQQIIDENIICESFQIEMKHLLQVIWFNLRVEPVGYVDGLPVAARAPEALHTNIQVGQRSKRHF